MIDDLIVEARAKEARTALRAICWLRIIALVTAGVAIWTGTVYGFEWTDTAVPMAASLALLIVTERVRPGYIKELDYWQGRMASRERTK